MDRLADPTVIIVGVLFLAGFVLGLWSPSWLVDASWEWLRGTAEKAKTSLVWAVYLRGLLVVAIAVSVLWVLIDFALVVLLVFGTSAWPIWSTPRWGTAAFILMASLIVWACIPWCRTIQLYIQNPDERALLARLERSAYRAMSLAATLGGGAVALALLAAGSFD